jgi:hypothetical protein
MNSTNTSYSYYSSYDDLFLTVFGSTKTMDTLYLYPFTILNLVGVILNLLCFVVFCDREFDTPLFFYLKVYTINSAVLCLVVSTQFVSSSYHFFSWVNSYWAQVDYAFVIIPIGSTGYFAGTSHKCWTALR